MCVSFERTSNIKSAKQRLHFIFSYYTALMAFVIPNFSVNIASIKLLRQEYSLTVLFLLLLLPHSTPQTHQPTLRLNCSINPYKVVYRLFSTFCHFFHNIFAFFVFFSSSLHCSFRIGVHVCRRNRYHIAYTTIPIAHLAHWSPLSSRHCVNRNWRHC